MIPIVLGKIKEYPDGHYALVAGEGNLRNIRPDDLPALKRMTGFNSLSEIGENLQMPLAEIERVYSRYAGDKYVVPIDQWNKLRWDPKRSLYINAKAGSTGQLIPISPPCDPWFCAGEERAWLRTVIERHLNASLPEATLLLANNGLKDGVFFWEVVAQGRLVLRVDFKGPKEEDWQLTFAKELHGIDWRAGLAASWEAERDRHIEANADHLEALVEETQAFIREIVSQSPGELPLIYFSGGKESMVVLDLFKKMGVRAQLLFAGTGMDFPEDEAFIQVIRKMIETDPEYQRLFSLHIEPGDKPLALAQFEQQGALQLGNMWCRSAVKYPIRSRAVDKLYPNGVTIAFEGSRWYENDFRRSHPRVNVISGIKGYRGDRQVWAHAIADWNGFDIWSYIYREELPINPLYGLGYQRTTCWSCPLVNPYHLHQSKRQYPGLWAEIDERAVRGFEAAPEVSPNATPF
jgi:3'-phosphoadenosine 5'-phosphosulfate sulfotransferase (PAPS reductase)/FAD synthetase